MRIIWIIPGVVLIVLILVDAFETILQPRRVTHRFWFARLFYRSSWEVWGGGGPGVAPGGGGGGGLWIFWAPVCGGGLLGGVGGGVVGGWLGFWWAGAGGSG